MSTEQGPGREEAGGAHTINRLLIRAARHHERDVLFRGWRGGDGEEGGWEETPDWRSDRNAIRVALLLRERLKIPRGGRVAVWLPPGPAPMEIERGAWMVQVVTVPVASSWSITRVARVLADARPELLFAPDLPSLERLKAAGGLPASLTATVVLRGDAGDAGDVLGWDDFMHYGGVLDTPERAAMCRTGARETPSDVTICLEYEGSAAENGAGAPRTVDQAGMARRVESLRMRLRDAGVGDRLVASRTLDATTRGVILAAWADGTSSAAFCRPEELAEASERLKVDLIVCDDPLLAARWEEGVKRASPPSDRVSERRGRHRLVGLLARAVGRRPGSVPEAGERKTPPVLLTGMIEDGDASDRPEPDRSGADGTPAAVAGGLSGASRNGDGVMDRPTQRRRAR